MTSETATRTGDGVLTAVRDRLSAADGSGRQRCALPIADGRIGLDRVAAGRPVEELVVFTAACAIVLRAAEGRQEVSFAVGGPNGPIQCTVDGSVQDTMAGMVVAVDGALRAGVRPPATESRGLLVTSSRVSDVDLPASGLRLTLDCSGAEYHAVAEFAADRFGAWWIETVLRAVRTVLEQFVDPRTRLAGLRLGPPEDLMAVRGWERSGFAPAGADRTLWERFAAQADRRPDSVAVLAGSGRTGYGDLLAGALRAAARLHGRGVRRGDRVALVTGKSVAALQTVLGVLRLGAAYVPLDPATPTGRLTTVLAAARCTALVADPGVDMSTPETGMPVSPAELVEPGAPLADDIPGPDPDDLAYVMHTSGSAGVPKGVPIRHRQVGTYVSWRVRYADLNARSRVLQAPSWFFDSSIADLFPTLDAGGALILLDGTDRLDPTRVRALATEHRATHVTLVPSLYDVLLDAIAGAGAMRVVTIAGEAAPPGLLARHHDALPGVRLVNEYGPTENSVGATALDCTGPPAAGFPIGTPIDNTVVQVVDDAGNRLPPGFPGEICLAGPGLADGYLAPAERSPFEPAEDVPGGRRYRTGDRGWWTPAGLEYLGRLDRQVKVRGHRVELGDVEAGLARIPGVRAVAVVARPDADGRTALTACLVLSRDVAEVRAAAAGHLPAPLFPARWVVLDAMPLLPTGKIDRQALAEAREAPAGAHRPAERSTVDGALRSRVAALMAAKLDLPSVADDDDFFELGGHSLQAIELISALESELGLSIDLDQWFDEPTVAAICAALPATEQVPGTAIPRTDHDEFALTDEQRAIWTRERFGAAGYNLVEAFWIDGDPATHDLIEAVTAEVAESDALRARFVVADGEPRMRIDPRAWVPVVERRLAGQERPDDAARAVIQAQAREVFDLSAGPPIRAVLLGGQDGRVLLVLTVHHIVCDGESAAALVERVFARLSAIREARPGPTAPATRFGDYLAWQEERDERETQLEYWRTEFAGGVPVPLLPADGARGLPPAPAATVELRLSEPDTRAVRDAARTAGATDFAVALATVCEVLAELTGMREIVVGTPVSLRRHQELRGVVGFFVNTVPVRVPVDRSRPLSTLVADAQDAVRRAVANGEVSAHRLTRELTAAGSDGGPLFTVLLSIDKPGAAGTVAGFDAGLGATATRVAAGNDAPGPELAFHVDNSGAALVLNLQYDTALFSAARAGRILRLWADRVVRARDLDRTPRLTPLPAAELTDLADRAAGTPTVRAVPGQPVPVLDAVAVADPDGHLVLVGVPGEIVTLAGGTEDPTQLRLDAVPTGWAGCWDEDGGLRLHGPAGRVVAGPHGPVDPAQAELVLLSHPAVAGATVSVAGDAPVTTALTATVSLRPGANAAAAELRAYVRQRLPAALTPRAVVVDRTESADLEPPAGSASAAVLTCFAEALGDPDVAPHDDFFELGGTSLAALNLATQLRLRLGVEVSPSQIFTCRTPAAITAAIGSATPHPSTPDSPAPPGHDGAVPLSPEQEEILRSRAPRGAFTVLEAVQVTDLDVDALRAAVHDVVARHDGLSSALVDGQDGPAWHRVDPVFGFVVEDLAHLGGPALADATQRHLDEPFDLASGELIRVRVLRVPGEAGVVLVAAHHIAVDGHSMLLITDQLAADYLTRRSGATVDRSRPIPGVAPVYREQRQRLARAEFSALVARRAARLGTPVAPPALPHDRPLISRAALDPTELPIDLGPELAERVRMFARRAGATPFMVLLAGLAVLLDPRAGAREVRLATTVSTRRGPHALQVVGLLSTTAVLPVDLTDGPPFHEVLARVRDELLDAQQNEVPFGVLAAEVESLAGVDRADLARVLVVAEDGQPAAMAGWEPVDSAFSALRPTAMTYDLALSVNADTLRGNVIYRGELFDGSTVLTLFTRFGQLLGQLIDQPGRRGSR